MATTNWPLKMAVLDGIGRRYTVLLRLIPAFAGMFSLGPAMAYDAPPSSLHPRFAPYAHELLKEAKRKHEADPKDVELAWRLGQAYFFAGEFATNNTSKASLAESGIAACEIALTAAPMSAEANYYYALNQGQLARTKLFAALGLVRQMQQKLTFTSNTKPKLDHAGADRCLALLYRDAPGWPISIGNKRKARAHLAKLKQLAPDFPENVIVWLETWIKWQDKESLARDLPGAGAVLKEARKKLTGKEWTPYWDDWDGRWKVIQEKARQLLPKKEE